MKSREALAHTALLLSALLAAQARAQSDSPQKLIAQALGAMGGADRIGRIREVKAAIDGHKFAFEQSERPEGPWITAYLSGEETVDFDTSTITLKGKGSGIFFPGGQDLDLKYSFGATPVAADGVYFESPAIARERLALGPERVLLTALAAPDLHILKEVVYHSVPHDQIGFTWGAASVRVLINHYTHLPSAVDALEEGQGYWAPWGDVTERTVWGNWDIVPGNILLPTLWAVENNGQQQESYSLTKVEVKYAEKAPPAADLAPKRPAANGLPPFKAVQVAPGIVQYQSAFNCAAVDQGDGVVILEGVFSSDYAAAILKDVATRFPKEPIKAVISTDDAWPHIGGLRQFAALGVPIYTYTANEPIVKRLLKAPFTIRPDELARSPRKPELRLIDAETTIGKGDNQLVLYPLHGSVGERMLYGYFPARKLAYAPDVIQTFGGQWFSQNLLDEFLRAVRRDGLKPDTAFAFHSGPISYAALESVVAAAKAR